MPIKFEGLEGILEELEGLADTTKFTRALEKCCLLVETEAVKKAPKIDGTLQQSITSGISADGLTGTVYTPLEYAPYVEYGTGLFSVHPMGGRQDVPWSYQDEKTGKWFSTYGQDAQPFMRPALDENRDKIIEILQGAMIEND
jgi:HK97 gp10 family phage protein